MATVRPLLLVGALAALVGCTAEGPPPAAKVPSAGVPAAGAPAAAAVIRNTTILALRGIPVTVPVPAGAVLAGLPAHGVVMVSPSGGWSYRSANGWWGCDTLRLTVPGVAERTLTIDVDRNAGVPELMSGAQVPAAARDALGCDAQAPGCAPAVSGDGRRVAFISCAGNLDGAAAAAGAVFLADRQEGTLVRLATLAGAPPHDDDVDEEDPGAATGVLLALDDGGRSLVHVTGPEGRHDVVLVHEGVSQPISVAADGGPADGDSGGPAIDATGRHVAFQSDATNLVAGDGNDAVDVFVRDLATGRTRRVSEARNGGDADGPSGGPVLSADGLTVAFHSLATDLVDDDRNRCWDVFVRNLRTGLTERVSVPDGGVGEADAASAFPSLSADGRWVAFQSWAGNLVADDTNRDCDIFVHDRRTGSTVRISRGADGAEADGPSVRPVISLDGRFVTFLSAAVNLGPGGGDGRFHAYRHDRLTGCTRRADQAPDGHGLTAGCGSVRADAAGTVLVFSSAAEGLVPEVMRTGMVNIYAMAMPRGVIN